MVASGENTQGKGPHVRKPVEVWKDPGQLCARSLRTRKGCRSNHWLCRHGSRVPPTSRDESVHLLTPLFPYRQVGSPLLVPVINETAVVKGYASWPWATITQQRGTADRGQTILDGHARRSLCWAHPMSEKPPQLGQADVRIQLPPPVG